ncbi:reverse transcriptase domain-containing protein [Tanacetum coccineum]
MIKDRQFDGRAKADPHKHIAEFIEICGMFRYGDTNVDAIKLKLFSSSLSRDAKVWFNKLSPGVITTWEEMRQAFAYKLKIPYPQRLRKEKMEEHYAKFINLIKEVRISVPFVDALVGIPNYGKFLKDLMSKKSKMEQISAAFLNKECSTIVQNKLPPKLGNRGRFLILCTLENSVECLALSDLGASINLMPYSLYVSLSENTLKPTRMSIRLANHTYQYPMGVAENMLVQVGKFVFPIDFVILQMEEDDKVPLILRRPFMHIADAIIRVKNKELNLGVGDDRITFLINKAM